MIKLLLILILLGSADLIWWHEADRRLPRDSRLSVIFRFMLGIFMLTQIICLARFVLGEFLFNLPEFQPVGLAIVVYIWHVLALPLGLAIFAAGRLQKWRADRKIAHSNKHKSLSDPQFPQQIFTRREMLSATAVALPPLIALAASRRGYDQMGEFRVRRLVLNIAQLPADLHGLTIAHVTDLHIGRFMPVELTGPVADAINAMSCDLIAFTGDLIDASCPTVAPGIDFLRRLAPRHGMVLIEGNHDVNFNADRFEGEVKDAGQPLLLDEAMTFRIPGRSTPVQFLGISWGDLLTGRQLHKFGRARDHLFREPGDAARAASIQRVTALREPGAFPILLAHHPHAFDPAAAAGFPLVLSGHTHGGQLMLSQNIGVGPLRFRYWAGLYKKPNSQLFISNGVGSWFPLRVNAPAEIVHLTLQRQ